MKAIVTVGLPASGKSTFAKQLEAQGFVRIERDIVRRELAGESFSWDTWDVSREAEITEIVRGQMRDAAQAGRSIVVADTNLNEKHRASLLAFLEELGFEIEIVFFDVPLSVCEQRNLMRSEKERVPYHVLPKLGNSFAKSRAALIEKAARVIRAEPCCGACKHFDVHDSYFGFCAHVANKRYYVVHTATQKACERFMEQWS